MFNNPAIRKLIQLAIEEDLSTGDITTNLCIQNSQQVLAKVIAKQDLVVCGLPLVSIIFEEAHVDATVQIKKAEGERAVKGDCLVEIRAAVNEILSCERIILNFLQRVCGVATHTHSFVDLHQNISILDTRKTTPGFRVLEKYATRVGGAKNHRMSLGDMVLVKNNHVDACPGTTAGQRMTECLKRIFASKPLYMPVEVEVRSLEELQVALSFEPTIVMLDNFTDEQISQAFKLINSENKKSKLPLIEVSGGVEKERLQKLATLGVSQVSIGALTTRAPNVDISLCILN